jgi:outer membrane receptor for ferrienterochelin and colicins
MRRGDWRKRLNAHCSLAALALAASPAAAQDAAPAVAAATSDVQRSFTPADFARFSPKTAYDMLVQVPGFTIRAPSTDRGLGQASENVLINSERVADKSGGAVQKLKITDASSVERIDLVDAAKLGIAGLSGLVANVILKKDVGGKGQFTWQPEARAHYSHANPYRGTISYTDRKGPVEYTLSVDNSVASRGAYGGNDDLIYDALGNLTERRVGRLFSDFDQPKMRVAAKLDMPGSAVANLSVQYGPYWYDLGQFEKRRRDGPNDRFREVEQSQRGYMLDFNGDYEFALGPGRMKFIGLHHYEHEPTYTTQTTTYEGPIDDDGIRFFRDARLVEFILRGEYGWRGGKNDWQVTLERAVNTLDQKGELFLLSPEGEFVEEPFPEGSGEVAEHRYEATATFGRALSPKLDLQLVGGGEISKLERLDRDDPARKFFRPKGSVSLAWRPAADWDTSLKLSRKVGQISFYDFLAQLNLSEERENAGNPDLVPPQSWELEAEAGKELGAWGRARLKLFYHRIDDIIDIVPIGEDGQSIGNLPYATKIGGEVTSTINFDPVGWTGAKLDLKLAATYSRVKDPLTGEARPISGISDYSGSFALRHDIAATDLAWGGGMSIYHNTRTYYLTEVFRSWEGPFFGNLFVEHKNVAGLTVRLQASNLPGGRHIFNRTAWDGFRDTAPVLFVQRQRQKIGPIFTLTLKGNF